MPASQIVLAVGFSHLGAIVRAHQARVAARSNTFELQYINFNIIDEYKPFSVENKKNKIIYNAALIGDLKSCVVAKDPMLIVGSLWSNQHFVLSTFNDPRRFDLILPDEPDRPLSDGSEIIPYDLINLLIDERCKAAYGLGPVIKNLCELPFCTISAPPPISNLSDIPGGSPTERITAKVNELGIAPAGLRYKIWKVCEAAFLKHSQESGVPFVRVPHEAVDANGYRRREYFGVDWIHASDSYGELVLGQIDHLLAKGLCNDEPSVQEPS